MHRKPGQLAWLSSWLLALAVPQIAAAQEGFVLGFRPAPGTFVHTLYETNTEIMYVGLPVLPDSTPAQASALVSETRRVYAVSDTGYAVGFTYDSVTARHRIGAWQTLDVPQEPVGPVNVWMDRRLITPPGALPGDTGAVALMRGLAAALQIALPADPLPVGEVWAAEAIYPYTVNLPGDSLMTITATITAPATGSLDSLVARDTDTLAYLTIQGQFRPRVVPTVFELGGFAVPAELWGSFAARLIWSTGWNAFVSGAARGLVNVRLEAPEGSGLPDTRVNTRVMSTLRVRP